MKHMDLFCASPASIAICSSVTKKTTVHNRKRPINRSHMYGSDMKQILSSVPCISQLPHDPKPFSRNRKSSAKISKVQRESSANIDDTASPHGSSRYLLRDTPFIETLSNSKTVNALVPRGKTRKPPSDYEKYSKVLSLKSSPTRSYTEQINYNSLLSSKSASTRSRRHQVVELRVSIHCKGCEEKVRKHISRMEGVTSFSIDMESKKVTIIGDVTALEVLTSISRVKKAQFWPSSGLPHQG